jgi:ribosomal protein S27AE
MHPSPSKRTKRTRDAVEEKSLEELVAIKRAALVAAREEAPSLRARAESLRRQAGETSATRHLARAAKDLLRHAERLEAEVDARESMVREHEFERTVVTYLRTYHGEDAARGRGEATEGDRAATIRHSVRNYVKGSDATRARRSAVLDEYLVEMERAPPKVAMAVRDECPHCDGNKLLLCARKSILSCPRCGYTMVYLDATSSSTAFDDVVEYSQYSYKRVNHYMTWVMHVQGKEAFQVPDDTLRLVMDDLFDRQRVREPSEVTQRRVRDSLRHLRLRKAYDHVAQVTARLSGVRARRLTVATEEKLKNMFLQMQPAFHRHAPRSRTNFLSYSYVLYRCFQILGLHDMLDGIALLKGRDKLEANDAIFRRMCEDLGWPVFSLPPPSETTR